MQTYVQLKTRGLDESKENKFVSNVASLTGFLSTVKKSIAEFSTSDSIAVGVWIV